VTVFAPPDGLHQEVLSKGQHGERVRIALLKDRVFVHFTRTALVVDKDEDQKKYTRKVVKVGIDPHFSYAYMLMNVAWARAHGTAMFLFPDEDKPNTAAANGGAVVNSAVVDAIVQEQALVKEMGKCGGCANFDPDHNWCLERELTVRAQDIACPFFL
jgi:hypothetical protein